MAASREILQLHMGFNITLILTLSCLAGCGPALAFTSSPTPTPPASPPNIVFILADDLGWDDVGFHGSEIKTPNIDKLAREGVILNNYYVQPICTPTRSAIMTGKYPIHTGMQHYVIVGSQPYGLPLKHKTIARHLKDIGYNTHAVGKMTAIQALIHTGDGVYNYKQNIDTFVQWCDDNHLHFNVKKNKEMVFDFRTVENDTIVINHEQVEKWHLGFFKDDYIPTSRGFDSHLGYYLGKEDYFDHTSMDGNYFGYDFHQNGSTLWHEDEVYSTEIFTSKAESIIKSHNKSNPLFLYLAHQAVHAGNTGDPIQAPQKYIDRFPYIKNYNRRLFAGVVSALDDSVGRVYKSLQDSGMAHNTIIIFSTDNGGPTNGYDRNAACNWPLRGCKETLWQGGVRGVGLVHSPLLKKSGYINNNMMHVSDWLPTILSAINSTTATPSGQQHETEKPEASVGKFDDFDGVTQWESISSNASTTRKEVLLNIDPILRYEGIVVGDFKLIRGQFNHGHWDGWYPPPSEAETTVPFDSWQEPNLDFEGIYKDYMKSFYNNELNVSPPEKPMTETELDRLIAEMNEEYETFLRDSHAEKPSSSDLLFHSENIFNLNSQSDSQREIINDKSIVVKCGPKPANASTNCKPNHEPCLFHLTSDPCEYNNLARSLAGIVIKLNGRLNYYRSTMVPPGNKPIDPNGNPQLHGGVWQPWL